MSADLGEYTCASCGGTFTKARSDEDAAAAAEQEWGIQDAHKRADMAIVCDDCFKQIIAWRDASPWWLS